MKMIITYTKQITLTCLKTWLKLSTNRCIYSDFYCYQRLVASNEHRLTSHLSLNHLTSIGAVLLDTQRQISAAMVNWRTYSGVHTRCASVLYAMRSPAVWLCYTFTLWLCYTFTPVAVLYVHPCVCVLYVHPCGCAIRSPLCL